MQNFTDKEILSQLVRILSSSQLAGSNVLSEFLNFIVRETIGGRGDELKEYTIGVQALKKESDFNPQLDSIVRIHAGRLRRALKEYYYEEGLNDPIHIHIPKGSYIPAFESRPELVIPGDQGETFISELTTPPAQMRGEKLEEIHVNRPSLANQKPAVAVLPFKKIGQGDALKYFTQGIGEYISTELTNFDNLKVISYYSGGHIVSHASDIRKTGITLGADYILTGSAHLMDGTIRLYVQLNHVTTGDQLWARTFEHKNFSEKFGEFQVEVVEKVLADVAGMNGVIARYEIEQKLESKESGKVDSIAHWYRQYLRRFEKETIAQARKYFEERIKKEPDNVLALAYLSEILSGETLLMQSDDAKTSALASKYAHRAIEINPYCQQGYLALGIHYLVNKKLDECVHILEEGLEVNPKSLDYRGAMGALLIFAGDFENGVRILDKVVKLNSHLPWWQILSYSYYSYHRKFYADALFWADRVNMDVAWIRIIKTAAFAQLDQMEKAQSSLNQLRQQFPFVELTETGLKKLFQADIFVRDLMNGVSKLQ